MLLQTNIRAGAALPVSMHIDEEPTWRQSIGFPSWNRTQNLATGYMFTVAPSSRLGRLEGVSHAWADLSCLLHYSSCYRHALFRIRYVDLQAITLF